MISSRSRRCCCSSNTRDTAYSELRKWDPDVRGPIFFFFMNVRSTAYRPACRSAKRSSPSRCCYCSSSTHDTANHENGTSISGMSMSATTLHRQSGIRPNHSVAVRFRSGLGCRGSGGAGATRSTGVKLNFKMCHYLIPARLDLAFDPRVAAFFGVFLGRTHKPPPRQDD